MPSIVAYVFLHTFTVSLNRSEIDQRQRHLHDEDLFRLPIAEVYKCRAESAFLLRVPTLTLVFV